MVTQLRKSFFILMAILLALTALTASAQVAPTASSRAQPEQETVPDGLMSAFLAASVQPFEADTEGYRAHSGGLDFTLRPDGLRAKGPNLVLSLMLSGLGREGQIDPLPAAEIAQSDNRLEYRRDALTEWYRDTALGVEQGFTIHRAPGGEGRLALQLDLSTDLAGALDADGRGLIFAAPDGEALRYDHLRAWDANDAPLEASLLYTTGRIVLRVNDRGATYPVTIDPLIYHEQKVIAAGVAYDLFGYSVALSGNTALVGASGDDVGANDNQGAAYVFVRSGTAWTFQAKLTASGGAAWDRFGHSVALSGNTALVGVPEDVVGANNRQGSAYVFVRSGTAWTQQARLTASDGAAGDNFGGSVALSGDTALVGAPYDDVGANSNQGSAYVFVRSGTTWTQQAQLTASDGAAGDNFGGSVALSGDTALVGAPGCDVGANDDQGLAYVFTRSDAAWTQQDRLVAWWVGVPGDYFGFSVALSGDTALVGARLADVSGRSNQGSAYVFVRSGADWTAQATLTASNGAAEDNFGYSVALSIDTALVGAPLGDVSGRSGQGSAYVFVRNGEDWTQQAQLTASDGAAEDNFGRSVALSGDTALVGASGDDVGVNSNQGSAYVFVRSGTAWTQQAQLTASDGAAGDYFGGSVALSGDTALVGAPYDDVGANSNQGSAYVFTRNGMIWTQQAQLIALDGAAGDGFGYSVALWGDTALVGAASDDIGERLNQGSAYVFTRDGTIWTQQGHLGDWNDGAAGDGFGRSVAISGYGYIALIGAPNDDIGANTNQGSVYVFSRVTMGWEMIRLLTASDGAAGDEFGYSVVFSGDTALVGAAKDDVNENSNQGSAYVFTLELVNWTQQDKLTAGDGAADDWFGSSVALSGDTALVGAPYADVGAYSRRGSAYIFTRPDGGADWTQQDKLTASDGAANDAFGRSVALSGNTALVGASGDDVGTGSAYVFTRSNGGTTWTQQIQLTASDGAAEDNFGYSVALSGNTVLVGASGDDVGGNIAQGAAYFYQTDKVFLPLVMK